MQVALKIILLGTLSLTLSFCASSEKNEEEYTDSPAMMSQEEASELYTDIENESRTTSSDYKDDEYGDVDTSPSQPMGAEADLYLGGVDDAEEPAGMGSSRESLQVEDMGTVEAATPPEVENSTSHKAKRARFKNGMHRFKKACNMRSKPSTRSAKKGKVRVGKKLWVEGHNSKWVKVFKKSGPVYVSRHCL